MEDSTKIDTFLNSLKEYKYSSNKRAQKDTKEGPDNQIGNADNTNFITNNSNNINDNINTNLAYNEENIRLIYRQKILENNILKSKEIYHLDNLSYLENYLILHCDENSLHDFPEYILSLVIMLNYKFQQNLYGWILFHKQQYQSKFQFIFNNMVMLDLNKLNIYEKIEYIIFIINAYKHLEEDFIKNTCMLYISSVLWSQLSKPFLKNIFYKYPTLITNYKRFLKKSNDYSSKQKSLLIEWINTFWDNLSTIDYNNAEIAREQITFTEKFIELCIDLLSQLPTRRLFKYLLIDQNFIIKAKLSKLYNLSPSSLSLSLALPSSSSSQPLQSSSTLGILFKQLVDNLAFYLSFHINEEEQNEDIGLSNIQSRVTLLHYDNMAQFQLILYEKYKDRLSSSSIKNINNIDTRKAIIDILNYLTDEEIIQLCQQLSLTYPDINEFSKWKYLQNDLNYIDFVIEILLEHLTKKPFWLNIIRSIPIYPTENILWDHTLLNDELFGGKAALPLPKLNMQFLSLHDYLYRNFNLFRLEAAYEIRKNLEDVITRMHPTFDTNTGKFKNFQGWARMGTEVKGFTIHEVATPLIGSDYPARILAEIKYSVSTMAGYIKKEWEELKEHDILFLVSFKKKPNMLKNGNQDGDLNQNESSFYEDFGIKYTRGCEVIAQYDENRKQISGTENNQRVIGEGTTRTLLILLDPIQYKKDLEELDQKDDDIYSSFRLLIRRKPKENNFKAILSTIMDMISATKFHIPEWLEDVVLGYGDTESIEFKNLIRDKLNNSNKRINFLDTFLDMNHYNETFTNNSEILEEDKKSSYIDEFIMNANHQEHHLHSFNIDYNLPYFEENFKKISVHRLKNKIRFSKYQIKAINDALREGLTLIEGPPGTGKTDVAVQIINLIYHNFPHERTLLITHSNHALNDLFEKIAQLNINQRYLLRLGLGEKELQTEQDFSKFGRVNYMLERRIILLNEVKKLSDSLDIHIYDEFTCETALIFFKYHVESRWKEFDQVIQLKKAEDTISNTFISSTFPFRKYLHECPFFKSQQNQQQQYQQEPQHQHQQEPLQQQQEKKQEQEQGNESEQQQKVLQVEQPQQDNMELENVNQDSGAKFFINKDTQEDYERAKAYWEVIKNIFKELEECKAFEILRNNRERGNYLVSSQAKIVAMTCTHAALKRKELIETGFAYDNIVIEEAGQILEIETFIPFLLQEPRFGEGSRLKRIVMLGDHNQLPPIIKNSAFQKYSNMEQSMFSRLIRLGIPYHKLRDQGRCRPELLDLFKWRYQGLSNLPEVIPDFIHDINKPYNFANAGFRFNYQFINVADFDGKGEITPMPYFYQNIPEAESIIATYMYMVLTGYPPDKITILTTYNGQKFLLRDIFHQKCAWNSMFKKPKITTVDKFQGQQNDYILLSLVRTTAVGHIKDPRRLVVAMSRARFGLYVFGRFSVFNGNYEMKKTLKKFSGRSLTLEILENERYPTKRRYDDIPERNKCKQIKDFQDMYEVVQKMLNAIVQEQQSAFMSLYQAVMHTKI